MKIGLAIQQVRSAEGNLADGLHRVGERHRTDQDIYHLSKKLERMSRAHIEELDRYSDRYRVSAVSDGGQGGLLDSLREKGSDLLETAREEGSGLLDPVREKGSEMMGRQQRVEAIRIINPRELIPIHYNDYEVFKSPLEDFKQAVADAGLVDRLRYLGHGETYNFEVPNGR